MNKNIKIIFTCVLGFALLVVLWFGIVPFMKPISFRSIISKYEYSIYSDHATICGYYGKQKELILPDSILGRKITQVDINAFDRNEIIEKVIISDNVEVICYGAFGHCTSLQEVVFGKNVKEIEMAAFTSCSNLEKVQYNESLSDIGDVAFVRCTSLRECNLPNSIKNIGLSAYEDA